MTLFEGKKINLKLLFAIPIIGVLLVSSQSSDVLAQQTLRHVDEKVFFDKVRKVLHRRGMTSIEFQTYKQIINYWNEHPDMKDRRWLAYVMATAYHETRLRPVREGFKTSDKAARKHVRWMFNKRIISQPYHLADPVTGQVYYGRGYVQLTWAQNYKKMGRAIGMGDQLYRNPDLVLNPDIASKVLFVGMLQGHFRYSKRRRPRGKQKLKLFFNKKSSNWYGARNIINGDLRKNGNRIAGYGKKYNKAIRFMATPDKPIVVDEDTEVIASPDEGEVIPSLPDTDISVSPDVPDTDTPDTSDTDTSGQSEAGDTDANASGEEEGVEAIEDTVVDVDVDTAGEVVPTLPEEGGIASTPTTEVPQDGELPTDVLNDPTIKGPSEGDVEVLPIGVEEVVDIVPTEPTEPVSPVEPAEPVSPVGPTEPVSPVEPVEPVSPVEPAEPTEPSEPPVKPIEPTAPTEPTTPDIVVEDNSWWGTFKSYVAKAGRYIWKF